MMKTLGKSLAVLLVASVAFTSCKKDKDGSGDSLAVTEENLLGTYTLNTITEQLNSGKEESNVDDYMEACEKDDQYIVKANNTLTVVDAGTQCDFSNGGDTDWTLEDGFVLMDQFGGNVEKLTSSELIIKTTIEFGTDKYNIRYKFTRK